MKRIVAVLITGLLVWVAPAGSATPVDSSAIYEVDVTNTPALKEGQPSLAVNPADPDNLVYTTTIFPATPGKGIPVGPCFVAYSTDAGQTWHRTTWPLQAGHQCGEPNVAVDSAGTFYLLDNQVNDTLLPNLANMGVVSRSRDGGRTWSAPVVTPLHLSGAPKLRVDQSTGKIYAVGGAQWEQPSAVTVSADGGSTWTAPQTIPGAHPCPTTPALAQICGYPGRQIAVNHGVLVSGSQDGSSVLVHVSRDDGRTWTSLPVTNGKGVPVVPGTGSLVPSLQVGASGDPLPWLSADSSRAGRFAVMVPRDAAFEVYTTGDNGRTWSGPAVIDAPNAQRPWMEYGPTGDLGVMWRTNAVDAFSTVSFDGGHSFSAPVRVNHVTQPRGQSGPPGDRSSSIALINRYAFVAWSDARAGELDGIFGRVPLSAYRHNFR
ncbi:sialidase family protein [Nocardia jiangxiensis]|uniref:Sialidase family protein n=1 Tax=Nocardia jiangxiensis TaxID=282685 RepID=A0ABW6RVN3_9NOCA|nr:sialidase family protein [Nocardia jiangxiensis]